MKVHTGKEKITEVDKLAIMIDWEDFLHYGGQLLLQYRLDKIASQMLAGVSVMLVIITLILVFLGASWNKFNFLYPQTLLETLPWIALCTGIYALYLGRNRDRFSFNRELLDLKLLARRMAQGTTNTVELDNILSFELLGLFDDLYHHHPDKFIAGLVERTLVSPQCKVLWERCGVDIEQAKVLLSTAQDRIPLDFDTNYQHFFGELYYHARNLELTKINDLAVFFALYSRLFNPVMLQLGVQNDELQALYLWVRNQQRKFNYQQLWSKMSVLKPKGVVNRAYTSRYAATLEQYSDDLTAKAATGNFVITLGKEQAMLDVIKVLQKQNNAAVMLIGDPGVGKSQFLKHLAVRMVVEDVPKAMQDNRLVVFNFNKAFTENQSLENFKMTLERLLREVSSAKNIIMVLDDMDQMLNVRADLQSEIITLLVSAIDKFNLRIVGTASSDGYTRFIKPIRNLSSLFQPVFLSEPEPLVSLQILIDQAAEFERKYGIKVQVDSLRQIVALAPKYAYERVMPDKAIDLLEEALLDAKDRGLKYLTADVVSQLVSRKVGVTVGQLSKSESEILMKLEETMHKRVVGQDTAIRAIAAALRRARAGLSQGNRPVSSFLFFGPTGVGKTEVARTLAATYYGDEKMMIRIDMSEYQEEKNLDRLIGYTDGNKFINGFLTEAVRNKPFSLILLDEIEKANPKVLDLFLQVLDEGHLTDGSGRNIDFTNTIIIATSNAGSRKTAELIGEGMKYEQVYDKVLPELKQVFRVEFLNRFDKIIMFKPLLPAEVAEIAQRMLEQIKENLLGKGMSVSWERKLIDQLVQVGYDPVYGAREIRRVIQENVEDAIAEKVVRGELKSGGNIKFKSLEEIDAS